MNELSEERTHESHERTGLALERTLAAWLRTGLTMIGVGLGVAKLLPDSTDLPLARLLGIALICGGGVVFLLGYHTYRRSLHDLVVAGYDLAPEWLIISVGLVLAFATVLAVLLTIL
ncbi:MAG: YidH family protein [Anaerolineae bacterium]